MIDTIPSQTGDGDIRSDMPVRLSPLHPTGGRRFTLLLMVCLLLHALIVAHAFWNSSACTDEPDYIAAGRYIFETNNWRSTSALFHPPLAYYWSSLPFFAVSIPDTLWNPPLHPGGWVWYDQDVGGPILRWFGDPLVALRIARFSILFLSLFLLALLFTWSWLLWGWKAAGVTGMVYALSPGVLAQAGLATTDVAFTLFLTGHAFCFWLMDRSPSWKLIIAAAVIAGGCLGSKVNGLFALPLGILWLIWFLRDRWSPRRIAGALIVYIAVPWIILWSLYGLTIGPAQQEGQRGDVAALVLDSMPGPVSSLAHSLLKAPIPMPPYLRLIGNIVAYNRRGTPAFLAGEFRTKGWWYYFPLALALKIPVPVMLLVSFGWLFMITGTGRHFLGRILLPQAAMILVPAMMASLNIGVRHVLPLEPLFALSTGAVLAGDARLWRKGASALLLVWLAFETALVHPSPLSYFNEFAGGTEGGERWLSDSNIDFSLDFARLAEWQRAQGVDTVSLAWLDAYDPADYGVRYVPYTDTSTGVIAIEVMKQQFGRDLSPNPYERLEHLPVEARIGGSIKIYRLPERSLP